MLTIIVLWQFFVLYIHLYKNLSTRKLTHENFVTRNILKLQYHSILYYTTLYYVCLLLSTWDVISFLFSCY